MLVLTLNASNIDEGNLGRGNNTLIYKFPNTFEFTSNHYIAVASVSMYYSWFNISQALGNNTLSYTWTSGTTTSTITVVIPDGIWEITTINKFLQDIMILNGHYLLYTDPVSAEITNQYYMQFILNTALYGVNINTFLVPKSLPTTDYSTPANFAGFPTSTQNPVITLPSKFNYIVGYTPNFKTDANINNATNFPTAVGQTAPKVSKNGATGTISYLSSLAPNLQPNNSVQFSLDCADNRLSVPSNIVYALTPIVPIGGLIQEKPPTLLWNKVKTGQRSQLTLQLYGSDGTNNLLQIQDSSMLFILVIKDKRDDI